MKISILFILAFFVSNTFANSNFCKKLYSKKKWDKNKSYKLKAILDSKSLCGFNIDIDTEGVSRWQYIISKNPKKEVVNSMFPIIGLKDICVHSFPIDNEIECPTNKDYFSTIVKYKKESFIRINVQSL